MRSIRGVVAALLIIAAVALLFMVPLAVIMGPQRALDDSGLVFTTAWIGISMVTSLAAACFGGWFVHRLAGSLGAVIALAAIVAVLGLLDAVWHQWFLPASVLLNAPQTWYTILVFSREPMWYDLTLPVLMAIFIWVAGSSRAVEHPEPS